MKMSKVRLVRDVRVCARGIVFALEWILLGEEECFGNEYVLVFALVLGYSFFVYASSPDERTRG